MLDFSTYTYDSILADALARVPSTVDKREGSIIYDALAPACAELAQAYIEMQNIMQQTYALTAEATYLDYRVAEAGITRKGAIFAQVLGLFADSSSNAMAVPLNSRFSTPAGPNSVVFDVTSQYTDPTTGSPVAGQYVLTAETSGTIGNGYTGPIIPISYVNGLASAVISEVLVSGEPAEADGPLLARYLEKINQRAFGGNIEDYRQAILALAGIGAVQVYPVWNGGGTVKCSILTTAWGPAASDLVASVQAMIDPSATPGQGLGTSPIGHVVTITTATNVPVPISATLTLATGYTLAQVTPPVNAAVAAYFLKVQQSWGTAQNPITNTYASDIFLAQVSAAMLSVPGVINVSNLKLNGVAADFICTENATTQQLPVLGAITLGT